MARPGQGLNQSLCAWDRTHCPRIIAAQFIVVLAGHEAIGNNHTAIIIGLDDGIPKA